MLDLSLGTLAVLLSPSIFMILGSIFALNLRVSDKLQACTQNFSAGLLISAVAGELYPLMSPPDLSSVTKSVAITAGFALGLAFMLSLEHLTEGEEGEDEDEEPSQSSPLDEQMLRHSQREQALRGFFDVARLLREGVSRLRATVQTGERDAIDTEVHAIMSHVHQADRHLAYTAPLTQQEIHRMAFHTEELSANCEAFGQLSMGTATVAQQRKALKLFTSTLDHIHEHTERPKFQRWKPEPLSSPGRVKERPIPWALVGSVTADGGVDGLLIGLAYAASPGAGLAMSIATCIEMGFLGLSFCATISNATTSAPKRALLTLIPPMALGCAALIGTEAGAVLDAKPAFFVAFIGFSVVCLLFLVTQELLAEAREVAGDSAIVNSMLFVGLLSGILLSTFLD
jgi:zinc transporter ZupT